MANSETFWAAKASQLARQINSGWFLQRWLQIAVPGFALGACGILLARYNGWEPGRDEYIALGVAFLMTFVGAWFASRDRFVSREQAMVRLEAKLGLNTALSSAAAGVGEWPEEARDSEDLASYRWRWARVLLPGVLAALTFATALLIPMAEITAVVAGSEEPGAWGEMDDWLETLEEEEVVDPESVDEVREQIETLRDRPENEWFSHRSLEAGDSLKDSLQKAIQTMGKSLETLDKSLTALESTGGGAAEEGLRAELAEQYSEAMEQLRSSSLALDPGLMEQLANLDPTQLQQLSAEEMKELQERLRKSAGA